MASGILALLDDVAALMDDTAVISKIAAKKTAGILGDDLAVNAEKATGFQASRELPVLWAITKGSLLNKIIILPLAFLLSAYAPWMIVPILLLGGAYLSFEGAEKVLEWIMPHHHLEDSANAMGETEKIKAAIRTDFILSIEIVVIALGTVMQQQFIVQILSVSFVAVLATVGVYGLVALLVRMDDMGLYLRQKGHEKSGALLIAALPKIIRILGIVGTIAMLLVGGGMFVHNIEAVHHLLHSLPSLLAELLSGLAVGAVLVGLGHIAARVRQK